MKKIRKIRILDLWLRGHLSNSRALV